ncbi:HAMP domain-containing sensor histidine kinase [Kitasatospora sp. GP82]|uniref:sensor histidine kinase n=1 Tax=Kitasatospora sp. GP82 TaxID=3035089 RepID=UPI00247472CF|nr:HAMP domain-containing sensor histidine kinase [Kitasatospora sp. GP82]MDH6125612.1 two-component system sensor histidine kinase PrrB [Kitasatospora sp. GP82]
MRLSTRIALSVTVLVPLLVLTAGLLVLGLVGRDLRHQQDTHLQDRAAAVQPDARALLTADRNGRPKVEQNQHRKVLADALDAGIRVQAADGTLVLAGGPQLADSARLPARTPGGPVTVRDRGRSSRVLAVQLDGQAPGTLWLLAPASATDSQLAAVRQRVLLVALVTAPASGLLAYALAGRATASLRRLSRRAAELDPGAGTAGFATERANVAEVDELATSIAQLLSRYEEQAGRTAQALDTARSFSSAASHELRTPLMSMRTNLDVLAAHPDLPAEEKAEVVADLQSEHARLLELLTALRSLAQGDLVELSAFGPLDLAELTDSAAGETARHNPEAVLTTDLPPELRMFGWEAGLRILLVNLFNNAVVHGRSTESPEGAARIAVRLRAEGHCAVLTVDDCGPGIPEAERAEVFHRFRRRPGSPGSGLGLTLVAQQVALHRGTVLVGTPPDGVGCRFEVRLPLPVTDAPTPQLPARRDWLSAEDGHEGDRDSRGSRESTVRGRPDQG